MGNLQILFIDDNGRTLFAENSTSVYTSWAVNPLKGFKVTSALLFSDDEDDCDYIVFPDEDKIDAILTELFSFGKADLRGICTAFDADEFDELDYADIPNDNDVDGCRKAWYKYAKKHKYIHDKYLDTIPIEYR